MSLLQVPFILTGFEREPCPLPSLSTRAENADKRCRTVCRNEHRRASSNCQKARLSDEVSSSCEHAGEILYELAEIDSDIGG